LTPPLAVAYHAISIAEAKEVVMDMTRVSACSYGVRHLPWEEALAVIAAAGFTRVDLLGRAPHLSLDPSECDSKAVLARAGDLGLRIANLGTYVGRAFASDDDALCEQELAQARRAIDLAVLFGARSIRVSPGDDDPLHIERMAPWFRRAAEYAARRGVAMGFETHGGGISGDPERCVALARAVGSPAFGVLYDPCNVLKAGVDYRRALDIMAKHIVHVHVKDATVRDGAFHLTMLGEGDIDVPWLLDALDDLGYRGDLALEYELDDPPPAEGLRLWYEAARRIASPQGGA